MSSPALVPIIVIPARLAASRLLNKPLAMIGDKPMIIHCLERAQEADIAEVIVAAGDQEIVDCVHDYGGAAMLTEADLPSGSDRVQQAITRLDEEKKYNYVINFQGDLPFFSARDLRYLMPHQPAQHACVRTLVTCIQDVNDISDDAIVKVQAGFAHHAPGSVARALAFSRQPVPWGQGAFLHHIGIYGYPRAVLQAFVRLPAGILEKREKLEQLRLLEHGYAIEAVMVATHPLSVDTPADLEKARAYWKENVEKRNN